MHNAELKIDVSGFKEYRLREYLLDNFSIQAKFASSKEVKDLKVQKKSLFKRILARSDVPASTYILEKLFCYNPDVLVLPDGVYLEGYWQSEKYFKDIKTIIRQDFTLKRPQKGQNKKLAGLIGSSESVSIHIRRGDYILDPQVNKVHGTCDLDYYYGAIDKLTKSVHSPSFFIFSDDPKWVQDHICLAYPTTYVDFNGPDKAYEDLSLMSQCRHHIIANSTFSWWGAWLNENPDKMVIAPKRWFNDNSRDTKDLMPDNWIRM